MAKKKPKRRRPPNRPIGTESDTESIHEQVAQDFEKGRFAIGLAKLDDIVTDGQPTLQTWLMIGHGLIAAREFSQSLDALQQALRIDPQSLEAQFNLASAQYELGEVDEAVERFRTIIQTHDSLNGRGNLATIIPGAPRATNQEILDARTDFGRRLQPSNASATDWTPPKHDSSRRLRIGYVSAYFTKTNYMKPVSTMIRGHDRDRFEIHLFSDHAGADEIEWFEQDDGHQVHESTKWDNERLVEKIRERDLDVLVDLNAYSIPMRLPIYTCRLARRVAAWFNMYATSGLPHMDYIIGDRWVIPESEEPFYTEQVLRLPISYLAFEIDYDVPDVVAPPCSTGNPFTFGSLISQYKITPEVYDAWASIMRQAPEARLLLGNRAMRSTCNRDYVKDQFTTRDVDAQRIVFAPPADHGEFLKHYHSIDLALDAFPYNGGTTTTEAIWQGVPVLTTDGDRWASRTSKTLLANAGLDEFVAQDVSGYVHSAASIANDPSSPGRLKTLRFEMRDRLQASPVCDRQRLTREMERLFIDLE